MTKMTFVSANDYHELKYIEWKMKVHYHEGIPFVYEHEIDAAYEAMMNHYEDRIPHLYDFRQFDLLMTRRTLTMTNFWLSTSRRLRLRAPRR